MQTISASAEARQAGQVAARFTDLLGLRQATGGAGLLLAFAWSIAFPMTPSRFGQSGGPALWPYLLLVAGLGATIAGVRWINGWYRREYGEVEGTRPQKRVGAVLGAAGVLSFLVPLEIEDLVQNSRHVASANVALFTLSLWIVCYGLYLGPRFWHYLVIAAAGFAFGVATAAGMLPATLDWHIRELLLYFGLASLAGGLIDHVILTRSLPRPRNASADGS